ncbi:MAG: hypothetical protein O7G83_02450, partial [Proteobacteria bacterium]|nr:hypothetical protein [Pseudomonadota bacterium]
SIEGPRAGGRVVGAALNAMWAADSMQDIHPRHTIAISDDSEVVRISAKKLTGECDKLGIGLRWAQSNRCG